jgi:NAD(P)H-dependent FMN reductase
VKISIISGSHRQHSQSEKVARYVQRVLEDEGLCDETWLFPLAGNPLPLWDETISEGNPGWAELLDPVSGQLASSDGFVVVSPEWHGQVPAGLKNFFLMWRKGEVAHKPALIVTVSSADGGAYPVAELRMSSYKNNRICYLPEHVIIRNVEKVLNDDPAQNNPDADSYFRARIRYALGILKAYAKAFTTIRASGATDLGTFKNGM